MKEEKIRAIVYKYRIISTVWLGIALLFSMSANWFLVRSNREHHFELGIEYTSGDQGYIWMVVILGLNVVLYLLFYSLEKILLYIHQEKGVQS
ncbi:hypothetical protein ACO1PK_00290 [Alishewanella sp. d11]|uniref:hypothetical protein n=1 Tax=Alishewanella sp. d11 TaxID=3414030 RepID=UPI003BF7D6A8